MKNYELFSEIIDSYHNGQTRRAKNQIERYGKNVFLYDLVNHNKFSDYMKISIIQKLITFRG